ncbi:hypothetical protein F5050DRAFT_1808552 [Lentinula boryana]|uniref:non-specific serine/threonine protein kinase n=1 Tax=Lentinula boryana TaxID=40481 RepID=A0ABQ8QAW1_9AGAR|nr:hypothetical protein F5050DRAFT_1808552 [Lentinula boryana]
MAGTMMEASPGISSAQEACNPQPTNSSSSNLTSNLPPPAVQPSVVTTSLAQTTRLADGKKMINQYVMDAKVGSGQHGNVWRCYENKYYYSYYDGQNAEERERVEKQRNSKVLAMKIVKRDNPKARRERQYKMLRMRGGLGAVGVGPNNPGSSAGNTAGASNSSGTANGLGTTRPRSTPTVVDGIRTAEQEIRKEIAIMKKCRHPHVVRLYEVIDDRKNEMVFMVMEYLGGGEIQYTSPLSPGTPILTVEQTRRIMRDAILGLEYLHHQGIIHRDIKPANLLWSTDHDRVKIADFGTAHFSYAQRLAAAKASNSPIDDTEEDPLLLNDADLAKRAGSPAFLAPEIVWEFVEWPQAAKFYPSYSPISPTPSEGAFDPASADAVVPVPVPVPVPPRPPVTKSIDIWALGVTLYCLLFGKTPFRPPGEEGERITEWVGYHWVCNRDWRAEEKMGWDGVLTGGQKAREGQWKDWVWLMTGDEAGIEKRDGGHDDAIVKEEGANDDSRGSREGALVMHLLDHFLHKDLERRITLEEVKLNPWFLHDLPNPDYWLRMTSPNDTTSPSAVDTTQSLSSSPAISVIDSIDDSSLADSTSNGSNTHPDVIIPGSSAYPAPPTSSPRATLTSGISGITASGFITPQPASTVKYLKSAATSDEEDSLTPLSQIEKIEVTEKERDDAMSVVKFRWRRQGGEKKDGRGSREAAGGVGKIGEDSPEGGRLGQAQMQKGSFLRISHRITNFLRGAVPSRTRPSLPVPNSTSIPSRTSRVDRTSSKRSSRSSGRRESKSKDIGDRGPVTSEPNMRLRALKRDDRNTRARERDRRRVREKEEAKGNSQRSPSDITKLNERKFLERAIVGTANSRTSSRTFAKNDKSPTVRPSASAPERRLRERGLEDAERTPRLGVHGLPSSATPMLSPTPASPRDKWKGKAKETQDSEAPRRYSISLRRSISRSRSPAIRPSRSPTPDAGTGSITPTLTATTSHPNTSMSPMGKIFSSLSSGWRRSESVVSLGLGLAHGHLTHTRSSSSVPGATGASTMGSPSSAPSGTSVSSAVPPTSKTGASSSSSSAAPSLSASPISPSSPVASSSTSARPRPNHALTQTQLIGFSRLDSRVRSHSRFFVDSDDESLDLDDDNMSLFSDEGESRRVPNTSAWNQQSGYRHPAELESLEPEQLSPTSPISFSRSSGYDGSDYEYMYEHRYNSGPPSSSAFAPRRRGWDAVSDGDIVDVMSNLEISDDEESKVGEVECDKQEGEQKS